jgi:hypothetical protein
MGDQMRDGGGCPAPPGPHAPDRYVHAALKIQKSDVVSGSFHLIGCMYSFHGEFLANFCDAADANTFRTSGSDHGPASIIRAACDWLSRSMQASDGVRTSIIVLR